ncbi:MAG: hypothetical protein E3K32_09540 [wastewater metagenome]|nr:hypothetical protein [Candidatus Loosdrechtia aerotolerans]
MKHKSAFVPVAMFLVCLSLFTGLIHNNSYGNTRQKDNHSISEICGVVSSLIGPVISILNDTLDIDASEARIRLEHCNNLLSVNDIAIGDLVEAKGFVRNGTFVAKKVEIKGLTRLEGTITGTGSSTITVLGQIIDTSSAFCIKGIPVEGKKARVYVRNSESGLTAIIVKVD